MPVPHRFRLARIALPIGALLLALTVSGCNDCPEGSCKLPDGSCSTGIDTNRDGSCDRVGADWSRDAKLPDEGHRRDIYGLGAELNAVRARGHEHSLVWPVNVSGILLPWQPVQNLFADDATDAEIQNLQSLSRRVLGFGTLTEMFNWVGLPRSDGRREAEPGVPWPEWVKEDSPLGFGTIDTSLGESMTFSCALCHTANLFGRTVVGLTNRRAKANEFFHLASGFFPTLDPQFFADSTGANDQELDRFIQTQENFGAVGSKIPQVRGLDTSLAQVAISLSRRDADEWATRNRDVEENPRPNDLQTFVADSKPAVWWTLKYKTRWLSDGSIVSGNPIFTNFLWNELGRGTDLKELNVWLRENLHVVDELTVAAFANEPPKWVDFFGVDSIDEEAARRGEVHFKALCVECHGSYEKGWSAADAGSRTPAERLATTTVRYHDRTPVRDVGTSPNRAQGMAAFAERLNGLAISKWMETVVEVQNGYVPPPLDGIWARYPYLHNQSVPTLCELLGPAKDRTTVFWMGTDENPDTDFDSTCVGLPVGDRIPEQWKEDPTWEFDTTRPGLSNQGHDEWLVDDDGAPVLSHAQKLDLVEFLKTL